MYHHAQHRPGSLRTQYVHQAAAFVRAGLVSIMSMELLKSVQSTLERWVSAHLDPQLNFTTDYMLAGLDLSRAQFPLLQNGISDVT